MKPVKPVKYVGRCHEDFSHTVMVIYSNGIEHPLELNINMYPLSPTGFAWGYNGKCLSKLSLAILSEHLHHVSDNDIIDWASQFKLPADELQDRDKLTILMHHHFRSNLMILSPGRNFALTSEYVNMAINGIINRIKQKHCSMRHKAKIRPPSSYQVIGVMNTAD